MPLHVDEGSAGHDTPRTMVVEGRELTKVFRRLFASRAKTVYAVRDVSLSVHAGQIVGLIGPNGAGKSTLLNLLAGLIVPTTGHILVCGHRARSVAARRRLGYMPERPVFPGLYSGRAVLRYHGALLGLSARAVARQVDRSIQQLQMQEFIERPASDFSQGMKQRLALAIAIMNEPQLLLLDEPSNGMDPVGIVQLRGLLNELRDAGAAVVISSHRLQELEKLTCDYLFMHRGRILSVAGGTAVGRAGQLRIEVAADGPALAERLLPASRVLSAAETELVLAIDHREEIPDLVHDLSQGGARIMSVLLQRESIEDVFLRLCDEGT